MTSALLVEPFDLGRIFNGEPGPLRLKMPSPVSGRVRGSSTGAGELAQEFF
jgi:hypothetical protein